MSSGFLVACAFAWLMGGAVARLAPGDSDDDLVPDEADNCPDDWNPEQADADADGHGDACDTDNVAHYRLTSTGIERVADSALAQFTWRVRRMATGHLDGDGRLDAVLANDDGTGSQIVLAHGRDDGTFEPRTSVPVADLINDLAIRNLTVDPPKILVAHSGGFSVLSQNPTGGWSVNRAAGPEARRIRSDANGVVYVVSSSSISTIRLQPTGPPIFVGSVPIAGDPSDLAVARDPGGRTHVAVSAFEPALARGTVTVFSPISGPPGLVMVGNVIFPNSRPPKLGLFDFNGDGTSDLVTSGDLMRVFQASPAGMSISYTPAAGLPPGPGDVSSVVTGNFEDGPGFCACSELRCWVRNALEFIPVIGPVVAACIAGDIDDDGFDDLVTVDSPRRPVLVVHPENVTITGGDTELFTAYSCPSADDGSGDVGADGLPNTEDDRCLGVSVDWSLQGAIGVATPITGPSTTFTAVRAEASGQVVATLGTRQTSTSVFVHGVLVAIPSNVTVQPGGNVIVGTYSCPDQDADGHADLGADGVPGTVDDLCVLVSSDWSTTGNIGGVAPTSGATTTFTAGSRPGTGQVIATRGSQETSTSVFVHGVLVAIPNNIVIQPGGNIVVGAYSCPDTNGDGEPDLGADGLPGTADDFCTVTAATWSATGGSVAPTFGPTTTFTAGESPGTGQIVATADNRRATVPVLVARPTPEQLVFTDSVGEPTSTVARVEDTRLATQIRAGQFLIGILRNLCNTGVPFWCDLLRRAERELEGLVPSDARYTVFGPDLGVGDVPATLTSEDADGTSIEMYDLTLRPGSPVRSGPIVPIPPNGRIIPGRFGSLLFVRAQIGGSLRARAAGFVDAVAQVVAPQ